MRQFNKYSYKINILIQVNLTYNVYHCVCLCGKQPSISPQPVDSLHSLKTAN